MVALEGRNLHVRCDAAAAVDRATAVGELDLTAVVAVFAFPIEVVVIERDVRVVALNQPSARGVVLSGGQCQSRVLVERIYSLNQSLAERSFAYDQSPVMVLDGSSDDLCSGSRASIYQHDEGILLAPVPMTGHIPFFRGRAAMVGDNQLTFAQELVGHTDTFAQQATGILAQVEDQSLQVAHLIQRLSDLMFRCLVESRVVHIADTGADREVEVHAVARNLVANYRELQRFVRAFAQYGDEDVGPI